VMSVYKHSSLLKFFLLDGFWASDISLIGFNARFIEGNWQPA